ncbi:hypothetical protein PRK78_001664 [Emydomyces testavorans]|uniref:Uncharacterized protein n=1 Tax=Emydomyces testavorans TaxID=2070801 RepID=A0AAF0DEE3_9EURO|nr:hypothetical protein PRK78_001664 [Emydomyces testavorans]
MAPASLTMTTTTTSTMTSPSKGDSKEAANPPPTKSFAKPNTSAISATADTPDFSNMDTFKMSWEELQQFIVAQGLKVPPPEKPNSFLSGSPDLDYENEMDEDYEEYVRSENSKPLTSN